MILLFLRSFCGSWKGIVTFGVMGYGGSRMRGKIGKDRRIRREMRRSIRESDERVVVRES